MKIVLVSLLVTIVSGCAALSSTELSTPNEPKGVVYYMPKRDFLVTLEIGDDGSTSKATIGQTAVYPDISRPYLLQHRILPLAKNETEITVVNGLLTASKSTMTSSVLDAAKALAGAAGTRNAALSKNGEVDGPCESGIQRIQVPVPTVNWSSNFCDVTIKIEVMGQNTNLKTTSLSKGEAHSGIFYRMNLPYKISVEREAKPSISEVNMLMSPSESPILFIPISRGFFANAKADVAFESGVLSSYKQTTESEVVGAAKLPAEIATAYFAAIGAVFTSFKSNDNLEIDKINANIKLQIALKKSEACIEAIEAGKDDIVQSLECSK